MSYLPTAYETVRLKHMRTIVYLYNNFKLYLI